mmetsp:Transcript_32607/g.91572  ORF Transcript_32607/g.91572 Transcript_32607/m.91572 type:complete len:261 (+) Transcript_32607:407-1189(+)
MQRGAPGLHWRGLAGRLRGRGRPHPPTAGTGRRGPVHGAAGVAAFLVPRWGYGGGGDGPPWRGVAGRCHRRRRGGAGGRVHPGGPGGSPPRARPRAAGGPPAVAPAAEAASHRHRRHREAARVGSSVAAPRPGPLSHVQHEPRQAPLRPARTGAPQRAPRGMAAEWGWRRQLPKRPVGCDGIHGFRLGPRHNVQVAAVCRVDIVFVIRVAPQAAGWHDDGPPRAPADQEPDTPPDTALGGDRVGRLAGLPGAGLPPAAGR